MSENTKFYIIIIILAGIVLLQFLIKPKTDDTFKKTIEQMETSIDEFKKRNAEFKDAADTIEKRQKEAEEQYAAVRKQFEDQLNTIQIQIGNAQKEYVKLAGNLLELNKKFKNLNLPDSLPTLDQLAKQN